MFDAIRATSEEISQELPGDDLVPDAQVSINRGFTLPGDPAQIWPWLLQLGKDRAGWYLPSPVERLIPRSRRAKRTIDPSLLGLRPGDVIPDWGPGPEATFTVARLESPHVIVYRSQRGAISLSWAIVLRVAESASPETRIQMRLRLANVRRVWLARSLGDAVDALTVAGLAAGLRERVVVTD